MESSLEQAERHVREGEARVARQREILAEMERDSHPAAAKRARMALATMERTLRLSREHLDLEHRYASWLIKSRCL